MRNGSDDGSSGTESELWARLSIRRHDFAALEILLTSIEQNIERIDREIGTEEQVVRRSLIFVMSTAVFLGSVIVAPLKTARNSFGISSAASSSVSPPMIRLSSKFGLTTFARNGTPCAVGSGS